VASGLCPAGGSSLQRSGGEESLPDICCRGLTSAVCKRTSEVGLPL